MQFIADVLKRLSEENTITKEKLYVLKEQEVIEIINNSRYRDIFNRWRRAKEIKISDSEPKNVYFVHHGAKVRYINPLCQGKRIIDIDEISEKYIEENLKYKMDNYVYLDFDFNE